MPEAFISQTPESALHQRSSRPVGDLVGRYYMGFDRSSAIARTILAKGEDDERAVDT
jgi:hypothetical protein